MLLNLSVSVELYTLQSSLQVLLGFSGDLCRYFLTFNLGVFNLSQLSGNIFGLKPLESIPPDGRSGQFLLNLLLGLRSGGTRMGSRGQLMNSWGQDNVQFDPARSCLNILYSSLNNGGSQLA